MEKYFHNTLETKDNLNIDQNHFKAAKKKNCRKYLVLMM